MRRWVPTLLFLVLAAGLLWPAPAASASGTWAWPVVGPVIRPFDPPASPYGSGHRGIDIGAPYGTQVLSPAPGVVTFAGPVGGRFFVSVDHGGGMASTYSWVSGVALRKGDAVSVGTVLAWTGEGHPGSSLPHLHFGVKRDGAYIDPLDVLSPGSVVGLIRLAPLT